MKKKGFTLIEIIMVTAMIGIIMLLFSPMMNAFIGSQDRLYNQSKVDSRLNEVVEFIKRDVRNASSVSDLGDEPVGIFETSDSDTLLSEGTAGKKVIIYTLDLDGDTKYVQYSFDEDEDVLKVKSADTFTDLSTASSSTILSDVEECEFKYEDKILLFYFKIDLPERLDGKVRNEVRDVGISRINLE